MKTMLLFISLILITTSVNANDIEKEWKGGGGIKASLYKTTILDPESIVQSGSGIQVSLHKKNLFLYLSRDKNQVRFAGQSGPDLYIYSAGIGMEHKINKTLTLSIDVGWYEPAARWFGETQEYPLSSFAEGLCRYLNNYLLPDDGYPAWDYYTLNYRGAIGGKINLIFKYPITKNFSFNMTTGYRHLKLQENVQGRHYLDHPGDTDWSTNYWTVRYDRDFSAYMIGGMFVFEF